MPKKTKNYDFLNDLKSGKFADMVKEEVKGEILQDSKEVFNVMRPLYGKNEDKEIMYCIFMNSKNRVLSIEIVSEGTLAAAVIYPREVIKRALQVKAAAMIMIHNHPSGDPAPSPEDKTLTFRMMVAAKSMGITIHEHMVIGAETYFSFGDNGIMARFNQQYERLCSEAY